MLQIMILVCSTAVAPSDCQSATALDIIVGPRVASISGCGMQGQALLAGTSIAGRRPDEYVKIRCEPDRPLRTAQKS